MSANSTFMFRVHWTETNALGSHVASNVFSVDAPNLPAATDELQTMIHNVVSVTHIGTVPAATNVVNRGAW